MYGLPKLNPNDINNLNRPITTNEVDPGIKNLPTKKSPGPNGHSAKVYQPSKKKQ